MPDAPRRARAAVTAAVLIALTATACGRSELSPDPAVCKAALQAQYLKATAHGEPVGAEPAVCKGLPKAQVQRFAARIRAGQ